MYGEIYFIYLIAILSFGFAVYNGVCLILKSKRTAKTEGTIISVISPNPETAKARNSKWATVVYKVNGRSYTSQNRVQVSMTSQVGSSVRVRYDNEKPEKLYSFSLARVFVALGITVVCIVITVFDLV